jgi:hypothetical protein
MEQTHYTQIVPQPVEYLATAGATLDTVPVFAGVNYTPQYPVSAFQAGASLGRVAEINVTGAGATASVSGKRMTINVAGSSLTGTSGNGLTVGANSVSLAQATTLSAGAMPAYPALNATFLYLRGDGLWAIPPSGGGGGGGTMNGWRSQLVNQFNAAVSTVNITDNFVNQMQAGTGINITQTDLGGGSRFTISLEAGAGYTHPAYTPQNFMPSLTGNVLTVPAIVTDAIGSVTGITAQSFTLPSGGGSSLTGNSGNGLTVTANTVTLALANTSSAGAMPTLPNNSSLFLNGVGAWATPPSGGGGAVTSVTSGNPTALAVSPTTGGVVVTPNGQSTVLNSAWNPSTRILSIPVGTYQGGILTSSVLNQFDLTVAATTNTVEVRSEGVTIGQAAILNFKGAGVTVTPGVGYEINIPGATGGGLAGISINGVGSYPGLSITGAGVSVSGSIVTISGGGGGGLVGTSGNGLTVGTNSVSLAIATNSSAGAMPVLSGISTQYLSGAGTWLNVPSGGGGVTGSVAGAWDNSTRQISIPSLGFTSGLITSSGLASFVIPTGLPNGALANTLYHDGSAWQATSKVSVNPNTSKMAVNMDTSNGEVSLIAGASGQYTELKLTPTSASLGRIGDNSIIANINAASVNINAFNSSTFRTDIGSVGSLGIIRTYNGSASTAGLSFFGANTVPQQTIIAGNLASIEALLINYGLAKY